VCDIICYQVLINIYFFSLSFCVHVYTGFIMADGFADNVTNQVRQNAGYATLAIVLLIVAIFMMYFYYCACKEAFNANANSLSRSQIVELMEGQKPKSMLQRFADAITGSSSTKSARSDGYFTQTYASSAPSGGFSSTSDSIRAVLESAEYDCANRKAVGEDAWSWMNKAVHTPVSEGMRGSNAHRLNDNALTAIASGLN